MEGDKVVLRVNDAWEMTVIEKPEGRIEVSYRGDLDLDVNFDPNTNVMRYMTAWLNDVVEEISNGDSRR